MTPVVSGAARALARAHLRGVVGLGRIRRAWPADLDDTSAGVIAEFVDADGTLVGGRCVDDVWARVDDRDRFPGLAHLGEGARVVALRPGKRVVARMADGCFAKLARPAATARAARRLSLVEAALAGAAGAPSRPVVRHLDAAAGVLVLESAPGVPPARLTDPGQAAAVGVVLATGLTEMARANAARFGGAGAHGGDDADDHAGHHAGQEAGERLPHHDLTAEAGVLCRWADAALALAPLRAEERRLLETAVDRVAAQLRNAVGSDPVLLHRDLHEGQLLVLLGRARPRVTVLDWDTSAVGDAVIDVANLLEHLDRGGPGPVRRALSEGLLYGLRAGHHPALEPRYAASLALAREATRLRLLAVQAFRPRGSGAAP